MRLAFCAEPEELPPQQLTTAMLPNVPSMMLTRFLEPAGIL